MLDMGIFPLVTRIVLSFSLCNERKKKC